MEKPKFLYQYQEIARVLKDQILRGDFREGGRLPSERLLVERFSVQRNTVRQALALLEKEGQISIEGKRGSFVKPLPYTGGGRSLLINIPGGSSPSLNQLRAGFSRVASLAGYTVKLFDSHSPEGSALDSVPIASKLEGDIAAAMVWPHSPPNEDALMKLNVAVPVVLVDRRMGLPLDCVRFGDNWDFQNLAEHLIEEGHRKIGFISDKVFGEKVEYRWRGYASKLEMHSIPVDPRLSLFFHGLDAPTFALTLRHLLRPGRDAPTAIMCSNDLVALYLIRFLHDEGIRVPDDLAVTGYGNTMPEYADAMSLTTVDQPFVDVGETAAKILIERIGQSMAERAWSQQDIEVGGTLVVRGSTQSRRVGDAVPASV